MLIKGNSYLDYKLKEVMYKVSLNYKNYFNYILSSDININFNKKKNILILSVNNKFMYYFYLPSFYFFKEKTNLLKFLFLKKKFWVSFINNFFNNYLHTKNIYFFRLKLKGLGFYVKRLSKYFLCFFMAVNHFFYYHLCNFVYLKKKKKHFIFLSNNLDKLNIIFWNLIFLKKHNVYVRIKGLSGFIKPNYVRFIKKKNKL